MWADIYALYSTRDGRVRYVGQSGAGRETRFEQHVREAVTQPNRCSLNKWFQDEWRSGYLIRYVLLEVCDFDKRHQVESNWIRRFPRADLLNRRKRRFWWEPEPENRCRIREIDSYMRRHKSNVGGNHGIHYDSHTDCFRVLVYNGCWSPHWLEGDELVGGSEPIWFSDLARALHAQDKTEDSYRKLMSAHRWKDIIASGKRERERIRTQGHLPCFWD